ncbi:MAG: DinB family protein [Chloroflexota bacterium]|nr:DinB family protein [Chloroflexota bacterium]
MGVDEQGRLEPPMAAGPVEMVSAFLNFLRATLLWKIDGLSDDELRRPMTPSGVSLLGIVKHSAYVERVWFRRVFRGEDVAVPWREGDPDADWRIEPGETTEEIVRLYRDEAARSRAIVAEAAWETRAAKEGYDQTLGWILTHMVEEVARHCGHADILREAIDGATGE